MTALPADHCTVYKADMSYFSGKLEAYLRYKGIPYEPTEVNLRVMNEQVYQSTGFRKVPAIKLQSGDWLFDTTPTMQWLENHYAKGPILPDDPALRFLALLLEDYGDEWLWRPSMWWRWEPPASRRLLAWRIGSIQNWGGLFARGFGRYYASRQRKEWLWKDGVDKTNESAVKNLYLQELEFLQGVFEQQPYLLGSHPSAADFGYFGSMFRHFGNDPDPSEVMRRQAPAVYEWLARLWNTKPEKLAATITWVWPEGEHWQPLLQRVAGDYLPYLQQNAQAWENGAARFDSTGASLSFKQTATTNYRVWCREVLQREWAALSDTDQKRLDNLFANAGGLGSLHVGGVIESGLDEAFELPKPTLPKGSKKLGPKMALLGQPRN